MPPDVAFRPIGSEDTEFLCRLYASTREEELAVVDWDDAQREEFLRLQFEAQHAEYQQNYQSARFDLILLGSEPVGRLYVDRRADEFRIIDIALQPKHRGKGIGGQIMRGLIAEASAAGKPVRIHVERNNPALHLYERLGFVVLADKGVYLFLERRPSDGPA
jgi:ribosomal protein S18 acetylase RimI-like enzyme